MFSSLCQQCYMTGPNQVTGFTDDDGLIVFSKGGDSNIEVVVENVREY